MDPGYKDPTLPLADRAKLAVDLASNIEDVKEVLAKLADFYETTFSPHLRAHERIMTWMCFYPKRKVTHAVIARELGLSRETVSREIRHARELYAKSRGEEYRPLPQDPW